MAWAALKPVPLATNSPLGKYGFTDNRCGGCTGSLTCCTTTCVDLQTDDSNCGSCGNSCSGAGCAGGICNAIAGSLVGD